MKISTLMKIVEDNERGLKTKSAVLRCCCRGLKVAAAAVRSGDGVESTPRSDLVGEVVGILLCR